MINPIEIIEHPIHTVEACLQEISRIRHKLSAAEKIITILRLQLVPAIKEYEGTK